MRIIKNKVNILDDGRVEIIFLQPLPIFGYRKWIKFYTRGSELIVEEAKITGIKCHPKAWEEILKSEAPNRPELLENFRKLLKKDLKNSKPVRSKR